MPTGSIHSLAVATHVPPTHPMPMAAVSLIQSRVAPSPMLLVAVSLVSSTLCFDSCVNVDVAGNGCVTQSGNAVGTNGGNARSGNSGSAIGGNVSNTNSNGNIVNQAGASMSFLALDRFTDVDFVVSSDQAGSGGTSTSGSATGGNASSSRNRIRPREVGSAAGGTVTNTGSVVNDAPNASKSYREASLD